MEVNKSQRNKLVARELAKSTKVNVSQHEFRCQHLNSAKRGTERIFPPHPAFSLFVSIIFIYFDAA